jgi:DNA repair photolyase
LQRQICKVAGAKERLPAASELAAAGVAGRLNCRPVGAAIGGMELEKFEYKIVMDDGADTVVLALLADLELGTAAFTAAVAKYPKRNVHLRQGVHIISSSWAADGRMKRQRSRRRSRSTL